MHGSGWAKLEMARQALGLVSVLRAWVWRHVMGLKGLLSVALPVTVRS